MDVDAGDVVRVDCLLSLDGGKTSRPVVLVFDGDRFRFLRAPGGGSPGEAAPDLVLEDVTAFVWGLRGSAETLDVGISSRSQDTVRLRITDARGSPDAERLRRAVTAALPPHALVSDGARQPASARTQLLTAVAGVVGAALIVVGAVALPGLGQDDRTGSGAPPPAASREDAPAEPGRDVTQPLERPAVIDGAPPAAVQDSYRPIAGKGGPVTIGKPWGTPCAGILFVVGDAYADDHTRVLREQLAAADFLPVAIRLAPGSTEALTTAATRPAPDRVWVEVPIYYRYWGPEGGPAPPRPQGSEVDDATFWRTTTARDGTVTMDFVQANIYRGEDGTGLAAIYRTAIAHAVGIAFSDRAGSGLTPDLAASAMQFSGADVDALRRFSGC